MRGKQTCLVVLTVTLLSLAPFRSVAEQGLANCAAQFPGGALSNAPTLRNTPPDAPAAGNVHLCRRSGDTSFFALEYDPQRYAPIWVVYRISDTFGENGCASMTRKQMRCYFRGEDVVGCIADKKANPSDPFHQDPVLKAQNVQRLTTGDFTSTGHDRGHMAPNNTFSWHTCGAYKTFTMANMVAQWGDLNQVLWAKLEAQVLYWGVKAGPVYVVTGPIWRRFPSQRFWAIRDGIASTESFPEPGELLTKLDGEALTKQIPRPTGFYTVVLHPGADGERDRAIAFLVPHTKQTGLSFWHFTSTVRLVEEVSHLHFGFTNATKGWPDLSYWRADERRTPGGWDVRGDCQVASSVAGWMADRPVTERVSICRSSAPVN